MRKFTLLTALLAASLCWAAPVGREAAMQQARQFLSQKHHSNGARQLRSATAGQSLQEAVADAYYVFNVGQGDGFVIVSGDDRTAPILGYADRGTFDASRMPDNLKAWLAGYADQMRQLDVKTITRPAAGAQRAPLRAKAKYSIAPMLPTLWDQEAPYNGSCPEFFNMGTSATGCVATAMAQVMYYHQWPAATTQQIPAYQCSTIWGGLGQISVPAVAAGTPLAWDKMKPTYNANDEDTEACQAVATLMAACGASVHMNYANNANGGSSAAITATADALVDYFDYSATTRKIHREDYSYAEWLELMYAELEAQRPVLYGGQSSGGGHAFVVDGYDGEGLFHINWGWGGWCNGYFALSVANPGSSSGTGASSTEDGYSYGQDAVIGIKKQDGETADHVVQMTASNFDVEGTILKADIFNLTGDTHTFDAGFAQVTDDGKLVNPTWYTKNWTLGPNYGQYSSHFRIDLQSLGLADGTYKYVPVSKVSTETELHTNINHNKEYALVTVKDGNITTLHYQPEAKLTIVSSSVVGKAKTGLSTEVQVKLRNSADEFYGILYLRDAAATYDAQDNPVPYTGATIQTNETATISFYYTPVATGTNDLAICLDEAGTNVIGHVNVNVTAGGSTEPDLTLTAFTYANGTSQVVYGSLAGTMTVRNNSANDFDGELLFMTLGTEDGQHYATVKNDYLRVSIPAGESADVPFSISGLSYGQPYVPWLYVGDTEIAFDWAYQRTLQPGVTTYFANGTKQYTAPTTEVVADNNAVAVDLSEAGVSKVSGGNPNTIYFLAEGDAVPTGLTTNIVRGGVAEQLTLTDGYDFVTPTEFTANNISYTRQFAQAHSEKGGWNTIALPFTASTISAQVDGSAKNLTWAQAPTDTGKDLLIMEFDHEDADVLHFDYAEMLQANRPYLIALTPGSTLTGQPITFSGQDALIPVTFKASVTGEQVSLRSTLMQQQQASVYTLDADGASFALHYATTVPAFSTYIVPFACDYAKLVISMPDTLVGIQGAPTANKPTTTTFYNLSGQRVSKPTRGIYVQNGRKVVVGE